jgi:hypothetical protein
MDPMRQKRWRGGWTLVELMIIAALLSVVAIIELPHYAPYLASTSDGVQSDPTPAGYPRLTCSEDATPKGGAGDSNGTAGK